MKTSRISQRIGVQQNAKITSSPYCCVQARCKTLGFSTWLSRIPSFPVATIPHKHLTPCLHHFLFFKFTTLYCWNLFLNCSKNGYLRLVSRCRQPQPSLFLFSSRRNIHFRLNNLFIDCKIVNPDLMTILYMVDYLILLIRFLLIHHYVLKSKLINVV